MPSIVIGGENTNVGLRYLDELARQRQLAMQEAESAARLASINKASQSDYDNVSQESQYNLQFADKVGRSGGGGGTKLSALQQIHQDNQKMWADNAKMDEDKRRWEAEFGLEKEKQAGEFDYKKKALEQHWRETEAKGKVELEEAQIRSKDAQARLNNQKMEADRLSEAKADAERRRRREGAFKQVDVLNKRIGSKLSRLDALAEKGSLDENALKDAYESQETVNKTEWELAREDNPSLGEYKGSSYEDFASPRRDAAAKKIKAYEDGQVAGIVKSVRAAADKKGKSFKRMGLEDAGKFIDKEMRGLVLNPELLERIGPKIREAFEADIEAESSDARARRAFASGLVDGNTEEADFENLKKIKSEYLRLRSKATMEDYGVWEVRPPQPPKEDEPAQEELSVKQVMGIAFDVNSYEKWLKNSWLKIMKKTGSTTSLDEFLDSYYPSAEESRAAAEELKAAKYKEDYMNYARKANEEQKKRGVKYPSDPVTGTYFDTLGIK